jgi:hypothetical protein
MRNTLRRIDNTAESGFKTARLVAGFVLREPVVVLIPFIAVTTAGVVVALKEGWEAYKQQDEGRLAEAAIANEIELILPETTEHDR